MSFNLDFTDKAIEDIDFHKKSDNKAILKKLYALLNELIDSPYEGIGKT